MSGGEWKNVAMRLRDTAGNCLAAAVAYFEESDGPRYNHLKATVRKLNDAIHYADGLAAEDKTAAGRKEQTCAKCRSFLARDLACALYGEPCGDYDACSGFSPKDGVEAGNGNTKHETKNTKQQEGETQE